MDIDGSVHAAEFLVSVCSRAVIWRASFGLWTVQGVCFRRTWMEGDRCL